jgi:hypothetical protein
MSSMNSRTRLGFLSVLMALMAVGIAWWWGVTTVGNGKDLGEIERGLPSRELSSDGVEGGALSEGDDATERILATPVDGTVAAADAGAARPGSDQALELRLRFVGVVRTAAGAPLAEASVRFAVESKAKLRDLAKPSSRAPSTQTRADGHYELEVTYRRWVLAREAEQIKERAPRQAVPILDEAIAVVLVASAEGHAFVPKRLQVDPRADELRVDFVLPPQRTLSGRVTSRGRPVAAARVSLFGLRYRAEERTDEEGRFRFTQLEQGLARSWLHVQASGFFSRGVEIQLEGELAQTGIEVELSPATRILGRVLGRGGQPIPGALLSLGQGKNPVRTRSDEQGRYSISAAAPGRATLIASRAGYAPASQVVDVAAHAAEQRVDFLLNAGLELAGVLRSEGGPPIRGGHIGVHFAGQRLATAKTNERGQFEFRGLPAQTVQLYVRADGHLPDYDARAQPGQRGLQLVLRRSARLAGIVYDRGTGRGVPEFRVRLRRLGDFVPGEGKSKSGASFFGRGMSFASAEGKWQTGDLPLGEGSLFDVYISAKGYAPLRLDGVRARAGMQHEELRAAMSGGVTLRGRVVAQGTSVPIARAQLRYSATGRGLRLGGGGKLGWVEGSSGMRVWSDQAGAFVIRDLPASELRLVVEHSQWGVRSLVLQVPDGVREWRHTIELRPGGSLKGVVRDPELAPRVDVPLVLRVVEVPGIRSKEWHTRTDHLGGYSFKGLPFGLYRLGRVGQNLKGFLVQSRFVRISGPEEHSLDLNADGFATLEGRLVGTVATPEWALVSLDRLDDEGQVPERRYPTRRALARDGRFSLPELPAGRYLMSTEFASEALHAAVRGALEITLPARGTHVRYLPVEAETTAGKGAEKGWGGSKGGGGK